MQESPTIDRSLDLADLIDHANDIVAATVTHLDNDLMSPAAQTLMQASADLMYGDNGPQDRLSYVLYLDALIASPEALQASIRAVRDGLVAKDPTLALMR